MSQFFPAYSRGGPTTDIAPMTLQPSVFPLFIEDNEFSSLITLVNSSRVSSSALLTIRDPQGKAYTPVSIRFTAQAKVQIKVADLLQKIGIHLRTGSILLTQGPELKRPSIIGQLTLSETSASPVALTEEELVMPMLVDSQDLRSVSESATDAQLIAVTSFSSEAQHISAQCYKRTGVTTKTATLAPGGTALLYPCSKDSSQIEGISLLGVSETTESAGIAIHSDGPNGGFAAFGLARHLSPETKSNFLGSLQFIDPTSLQSSALVFTGVSAGYSLTPGAHPYSAAVAVANFSTQQNHITIAFHKTDSNGSVSSTTRDIALAPESSTQISLGQLGLKSGEIGSLIVSSDQSPGDMMAKIVSSSDTAPNQLEQLAKDSLSHRNGGAHPWTLQDNSRSDLVLFNHFSRAEPFNVLITTEDGIQWIQHVVLAPFETKNISINDLIRNKTPDIHGRIIPATTWSGTVLWHTEGPGIGSGHVLIRNDNNSTGENFSCDQAIVVCGASVTANPTTMGVNDTGTAYAIETFCVEFNTTQGYCGGGDNSYDDYAYAASWVSADSSVVSVMQDSTTATYEGMALGSTYLTGTVNDGWGCSASSTAYINVVPLDNTPVLTGIDPGDWPSDGINHPVTFTGQYFGNNPPSLTFSDSTITYSLLSYNDTQITADVTVPSGTPDEDVNVSITSTGYNGNGFASGGGAVSPTSSTVYASTHGVPTNTPEITVVGWIDPNAIEALPSGANQSLQNDLGNGTNCAFLAFAWMHSLAWDIHSSTDTSYANIWMIRNSANTDPGLSIDPETVHGDKGKYRLINDYGNGKSFTDMGYTPDPCHVVFGTAIAKWVAIGQPNPSNGASGTSPSGLRYKLGETRVCKSGQDAWRTISGGRTMPWVWSVISFDSSGNPDTSIHAMFPTYSVYQNGQRIAVYGQSSVTTFFQQDESYQFAPSAIP